MKIFVTGCAGFIGYHLCQSLLKSNFKVYAIDNLNNYYDPQLKKDRLKNLKKNKNFFFFKCDLLNQSKIQNIILLQKIKFIVHLAAQAGVRHSIKNPKTYLDSNIIGFFNILEISRKNKIKHLVFASTSSVYGRCNTFPLNEKFNKEQPLSFYAATKKSNELMAYSYANIYKLPCTALRFFTVYGPYGRPDMALFKFTKAMLENKKIELFNKGHHERDFTYVEDIVKGIMLLIKKPPSESIPYKCFNIGNGSSKKLLSFLKVIEDYLKIKAKINYLPLQAGDVIKTHADINSLNKYTGYKPKINVKIGVKNFLDWYKKYI